MRTELDAGLMGAALVGYQSRLDEVNAKIKELREQLAGLTAPAADRSEPPQKHYLSAEGRARIAAAQRRRWAKAREVTPTA